MCNMQSICPILLFGAKSKLSVFLSIFFVLSASFAYSEARIVKYRPDNLRKFNGKKCYTFSHSLKGIYVCSSAFLSYANSASLVIFHFLF